MIGPCFQFSGVIVSDNRYQSKWFMSIVLRDTESNQINIFFNDGLSSKKSHHYTKYPSTGFRFMKTVECSMVMTVSLFCLFLFVCFVFRDRVSMSRFEACPGFLDFAD